MLTIDQLFDQDLFFYWKVQENILNECKCIILLLPYIALLYVIVSLAKRFGKNKQYAEYGIWEVFLRFF
jgi:hypothetical protein